MGKSKLKKFKETYLSGSYLYDLQKHELYIEN